jgi:hypothetical protein
MDAGYEFHGAYERSFNKMVILDKARALRKEGNKAITVKIPDSPLSRSSHGGHGYAVYWIESEANKELRDQEARKRKTRNIEARIAKLADEITALEEELVAL